MTPTPPPVRPPPAVSSCSTWTRPPLAEAGDFDAGLLALAAGQEEFYDQLQANGEGGARVQLALILAPVDATGTISAPCYWAIINGMRPAER